MSNTPTTQSDPRLVSTSSQLADGWGRPLRAVICNRCDWGFLVGVEQTEARCPRYYAGDNAGGPCRPYVAHSQGASATRLDRMDAQTPVAPDREAVH